MTIVAGKAIPTPTIPTIASAESDIANIGGVSDFLKGKRFCKHRSDLEVVGRAGRRSSWTGSVEICFNAKVKWERYQGRLCVPNISEKQFLYTIIIEHTG
jgi:hypothetical protein